MEVPMTSTAYRDEHVNVKVVLAGSWIAMLFVFAYVDILAFFRADVLNAALDGKVKDAGFTVNQVFLVASLIYVLIPILMVVVSLLLPASINRIVNVAASLVYVITVAVSCVGETWAYYLAGSVVEIGLLLFIARTAWKWPHAVGTPRSSTAEADDLRGLDRVHIGTGN
jgi:hypothetical protein